MAKAPTARVEFARCFPFRPGLIANGRVASFLDDRPKMMQSAGRALASAYDVCYVMIFPSDITMRRFFPYPGAVPRFSTPLSHTRQWRFAFGRLFFLVWFSLTALLAALLYMSGFVPRGVAELGDRVVAIFIGEYAVPARPRAGLAAGWTLGKIRIIIPGIGLDGPVVFPKSADLDVLNAALLEGAVHYPGSVFPGEEGTVFLFGHSTGLAVVHNKNFEIFNRLSDLGKGDVIRLRDDRREYWYRVRAVELKRTDAAVVELAPRGERLLVLSTCNVFGGVDDRFIVTAEFTGSYPLQGRPVGGSS